AIAQRLIENEFAAKEDRKNLEEIAAEFDLTRQGLYLIRKKPEFVKYMDALSYTMLSAHLPEIDAALMKAVRGGNNGIPSTKAIELAYKVLGRLAKDSPDIHVYASGEPRMSREELTDAVDELNRMIE
ncbi:phBC6A51 family helix-turn-helix protein, partial [Halalkalibacter oceani]